MAAVTHQDAYGFHAPAANAGRRSMRTAWLTILIVVVASVAIAAVMTLSIILAGPLPNYDGPAWPRPLAEPSASAGLDL